MRFKLRIHVFLIFIISWALSLGVLLFWVRIAFSRPEDLTNIAFILASVLFLMFIGPPIILTTTYFLEDLRKKVILDMQKQTIHIEYKNHIHIFDLKDIIKVYHVKVDKYNSSRYKFPMYEYLMFIFKERKKLIITSLLIKPERLIIALKLSPKVIYSNLPFIDRKMGNEFLTSEEFDLKVKAFHNSLKNKTKDELLTICKQPGYAEHAKIAARKILNEMN